MGEPRPTCYRCFRPSQHCLCPHVIPVENRCRITVLQHPREQRHPFGTVRFVRLGLTNSTVIVPHRTLATARCPLTLAAGTGLLYPAAHAAPLARTTADDGPPGLVVLDGTWAHARTLYRLNPWLGSLPHYRLAVAAPSRYQLRRQPAAHCLSTIEAVVSALRILEPQTGGLDGLLAAFDHMVTEQQEVVAERTRRPRYRLR